MPSAATDTSARAAVQAYFDAIARRDLEAMGECWAPDGVDRLVSQATLEGPAGVRAFFAELFAAVPDFELRVTDLVSEDDRVAVQWRATGTFTGPGRWQGIAPTGSRVELEGIDLLRVRDGLIVRNDAFADGIGFARSIGMLPPDGSAADRGMKTAFNARTRLTRGLWTGRPERVADGVWIVRGGVPRGSFNVYFVEEDGGVAMFDAGSRQMSAGLASAAAELGGLTRVVLGHSHLDHRGSAPAMRAPVFCHPDEVADAEGGGGFEYQEFGAAALPGRWLLPILMRSWDGGPVQVAGTLTEGDAVGTFRVVEIPGHARGMIALFRESDRLALTTDAFYTLDIGTGRHGPPRLPDAGTNADTEQARASLRKLAALDPSEAWPGHADPVRGDVRAALERAADG